MPERIALLVNPTATRTSGRLLADIRRVLSLGGTVDIFTTQRHEHARELTRDAVASGATIVAVVGGDGTVAEAASSLAGSDTALLPVAAGSTNVFTRALGWPHPARDAVPLIQRAIGAPKRRTIQLGHFSSPGLEHTFCINAGFGIDAETVQIIESRPWIKRRFRHAGFGLVALLGAFRASRPAGTVATIDGVEHAFASFMVVTGSPYAYVGSRPLDVAPGAQFDGRLRWVGINRHRPDVLASVVTGAIHADGRHLRSRGVHNGWATSITIASERPIAFQSDGEALGSHREVTISVGPQLTVIAPPTT